MENPDARRDEREQEDEADGGDRRGEQGESDGEEIDEQHTRPEEERERVEFEEREQQEQQRQRREELAPPRGRGGGPAAFEQQGKRGVQRGVREVKCEGPGQEFRGEPAARPRGQQQKHGEAGDEMEFRVFLVEPGDREQAGVGQEDKGEQQARARGDGGVADEEQREAEGHEG